jgi:hypothetical protein
MSKQSFDQVIQRASSDARFMASLRGNFGAAVRPYDLSDGEKAQLAKSFGLSAAATGHPMAAALAASSVQAASNELASNELASNELASNELASNELASNELASNELASNELASNELSSYMEPL